MNVMLLSSHGQRGRGGQESLLSLIEGINRNKFTPHVVVPSKKGGMLCHLKKNGHFVYVINFPKVFSINFVKKARAILRLYRLVIDLDIKIIHTDGPRNTFYAGLIAKITGIPLIWHVRNSKKDRYDWILQRLSSKIVLVADALSSRFQINSKNTKFITIHNGVDVIKFRPQVKVNCVRKKYRINRKELLISVTARIERLKGQKYLIEACGKLAKKIRRFHILLAGEIIDVSYLKECKDKAEVFGIKDKVVFPGQIKNISQLLNETDIFVLPSLSEAFPRSVIEAMATGKPVIVANVGGCCEALDDKFSGFLVPAKDSDAIADKIYLLAKNKDLRERIGLNARKKVIKMFNIIDNVKKTEKLYYDVLKR